MTDALATVAGETLELCPERAIFWRRRGLLLIADAHFGKAASFRAFGVNVPHGTTASTLARLDQLIARLVPERIVFLGDFLHAREGRTEKMFAMLARWRSGYSRIEMQLVRGNHDRRAGDPVAGVGIACMDGPLVEAPFALMHHPAAVAGAYGLAGHLHPCVALIGAARQRERVPCFWLGPEYGVLPAFGAFTGCAELPGTSAGALWVVADDQVLQLSRTDDHLRGEHS